MKAKKQETGEARSAAALSQSASGALAAEAAAAMPRGGNPGRTAGGHKGRPYGGAPNPQRDSEKRGAPGSRRADVGIGPYGRAPNPEHDRKRERGPMWAEGELPQGGKRDRPGASAPTAVEPTRSVTRRGMDTNENAAPGRGRRRGYTLGGMLAHTAHAIQARARGRKTAWYPGPRKGARVKENTSMPAAASQTSHSRPRLVARNR